jgi:hypothetical protein
MLEDILDNREGKIIAILEILDQTNTLHVAVIIIGNVPSPLARLGKEPFPDVIVDRLLGYPGALNQIPDLQEYLFIRAG